MPRSAKMHVPERDHWRRIPVKLPQLAKHVERNFTIERRHHLQHPLRHASPSTTPATMRAASRLFAAVKPGQFLEAGAPTGLTGLATHPSPRSTLLHHYNGTLTKLQQIPESSVYRQSTEALTRHRLKIIEESKPKGWDEWQSKILSQIADDPEHFHTIRSEGGIAVVLPKLQNVDYGQNRKAEWDGEVAQSFPEGIRSQKERRKDIKAMKGDKDYKPERTFSPTVFAPEPQYTIEA